jgi:hypothetical protein
LQIVIANKLHVGGFGRSPDHLTLRMRSSAENEKE